MGRRWRDFRSRLNCRRGVGRASGERWVTAGENWVKKDNLTSLPPAGLWFCPARSLRKIAAGGHGVFPARSNFPQSPANIGASVRAGWRGGWQREAFRRDSPRSPSGEAKSQNPVATDATMGGGVKRRTSSAHRSRQSIRRSDETLLKERSADWASAAVAEPVAWGLGASQSCGLRVCPLAESLARWRVELGASGEHTSEVESKPARSGVSEDWSRKDCHRTGPTESKYQRQFLTFFCG
jgi:hypothetical protein